MDFTSAVRSKILIADGGLGTTLEAYGGEMDRGMWSTSVLRDNPALVRTVHRAFFESGAHIATTATYQASVAGLARLGVCKEEAMGLLKLAVTEARAAAAESNLVNPEQKYFNTRMRRCLFVIEKKESFGNTFLGSVLLSQESTLWK